MIAVPAAGFEEAVDNALAKGARAMVGITAGLGEGGGEALARERALVERVRSAGAMLLGPNCLGVFDASSDLGLASNEFPPGSIGLISQSGNLALELGMLARPYGLGFSRFASIGNQADLDLAELVASYAAHEPSRLIAVYAEDFRDGRAFVDAAPSAGKPVMLITVGRSAASARAATSHTGALVADWPMVEAACRAAGAHMVSTPGRADRPRPGAAAARPAGRPAGGGARRRRRARSDRLRRRGGRRAGAAPAVRRAAGRLAAMLPPTAVDATTRSISPVAASRTSSPTPGGARRARVGRGGRRADDRLLRRLQPVLR